MERLSRWDLRAVLEVVREVYAAPDLARFQSVVAEGVRKLTHAERGAYNIIGPRLEAHFDAPTAALPAAGRVMQWYHAHYAEMQRQHPLLIHWRKTRDGRAVKISDFLTQAQYHRLPLYNEALQYFGTESLMQLSLPLSPDTIAGITVGRGRPDFTERDRLVLNILLSHLGQAHHNVSAIGEMRRQLGVVSAIAERLPFGVVLLRPDGRVLAATPRAEALLTAFFGSPGRVVGRLPAALALWIKREQTTSGSLDGLATPRRPFIAMNEGRRLMVRALLDDEPQLLLLEERVTALDPAMFGPLGLTRRESEVLLELAYGKTNEQIGAALGMSPRTVGTHLDHIYEKLGVTTRAAAVRCALDSVTAGGGNANTYR